jgi:hypothetical protein
VKTNIADAAVDEEPLLLARGELDGDVLSRSAGDDLEERGERLLDADDGRHRNEGDGERCASARLERGWGRESERG